MSVWKYAAIFGVSLVAGAVNSIAGGGHSGEALEGSLRVRSQRIGAVRPNDRTAGLERRVRPPLFVAEPVPGRRRVRRRPGRLGLQPLEPVAQLRLLAAGPEQFGLLVGGVTLGLAVTRLQLVGRRKLIKRDFACDRAASGRAIMFQERVAV